MPDFITSHIDPLTGEDDSRDFDAGTLGHITTRVPQAALAPAGDDFVLTPEVAASLSRNATCPCGSGRKFKHCHGAL
jgi:preprotein translocase subunit SecA